MIPPPPPSNALLSPALKSHHVCATAFGHDDQIFWWHGFWPIYGPHEMSQAHKYYYVVKRFLMVKFGAAGARGRGAACCGRDGGAEDTRDTPA